MKRLLTALLALCLLLSLSACKEEPTTQETAPTPEAFVDEFVDRLFSGYYDKDAMYAYEDLSAYMKLGQYKGISYPEDPYIQTTVSDEAFEDYMNCFLLQNFLTDEQYSTVESGKVKKYDVCTISYRGYLDGEYMEGASAEEQKVLVGSHVLIPGFEEALIGAELGKQTEFEVTTSPYYAKIGLNGKTLRFEVTVSEISRPLLIPELNLESVNALYGTSFATKELFVESVRALRNQEQEALAADRIRWYLQVKLLESSTVTDLPKKELEHYVQHYTDYHAQGMQEGESFESYCEEMLGMTYEKFMESANLYAQEAVKTDLFSYQIVKNENLEVTPEQVTMLIWGLFENSAGSFDTVQDFLTAYLDIYGPFYFTNQLKHEATCQFLVENATRTAAS